MKRLSIVLMLALMVNMAMAQGNAVASAYNYLKNGQPQKAMVEIDKASQHDDTKDEAKTWFYKGNIYLQLYTFAHMTDGIDKGVTGEDVELRLGIAESKRNFRKLENGERWYYPFDLIIYFENGKVDHYDFDGEEEYKAAEKGDVLEVAHQAYLKSIKLDPNFIKFELNPQTAEIGLKRISRMYNNSGIEQFKLKDYDKAFASFENAVFISKEIGDVDSNLILYTGYIAEKRKDTANVVKYYSELANAGSSNVALYVSLANIYMAQNKVEDAIAIIKKGRAVSPKNQNLLLTEANIYLQNDRAKEAEAILLEAAAADPTNANLRFAIGANYDKMVNDTTYTAEQQDEAMVKGKAAYLKALELKPDYFDAAYNMGAMLNNKASALIVEASNLPLKEAKKYEALMKEATDLLLEAKPYLENCHKLQPKDKNTMIMLKGIYSQTKDYDNFKKIKAEMDAL